MRIILTGGVVVTVGDAVRVSDRGRYEDYGREDEIMKIYTFKKSKDRGTWLIGIVSERKHSGWGDLDGQVSSNTGTWLDEENFFRFFIIEPKPTMVISKSHKFRKLELEGMKCIVLSPLPKGNGSMVEFEKNVGGCGGDGLGKAGHCLIIPNGKLAKSKKGDDKHQKSLTE